MVTKSDIPNTHTLLQGRSLVSARVAWGAVALLTLGLYMTAVPVRYHHLLNQPPAMQASLAQLGLSVSLHAVYLLAVEIITFLAFWLTGLVIFWRKSNDWMVIFLSYILMTMAVGFPVTLGALEIMDPTVWRVPTLFIRSLNLAANVTFFFLFPDGRFVPPWTRRLALGLIAWVLIWTLFSTTPINPNNWPTAITILFFLVLYGIGLWAQFYRYQRVSHPGLRRQTKWIVYSLTASVLTYTAIILVPYLYTPLGQPGLPRVLYEWIGVPIGLFSLFLGPLAFGVSVLRYGLWDMDLVINRTLVYGALTAVVVGAYVVAVGSLGVLFQIGGNLFISLFAIGLVALIFQPLRERLQRSVNRLMYGERDDPYAVLARLGRRLETTLSPEAVLPTIVETISQTLKLPYVAIALKRDPPQEKSEEAPSPLPPPASVPQPSSYHILSAQGQPVDDLISIPLVYQGEILGQLRLAPRAPEEAFTPADRRLLDDVASQVGVAVHAVRLTLELQRSRERIITAREEERRRLRRDLHDGLGPALAGLSLQLDTTRNLLVHNPAAAQALLAELKAQIQTAIADIRRLIYDLRPPALDDLGLVLAIREYALHNVPKDLRVSITAPENLPELPAAVEVAAYRIALEALTNVVRHAHARTCVVQLSAEGLLELKIMDDGIGLPAKRRAGVGLTSMQERAAELGGTCIILPLPQAGTQVLARLPLLMALEAEALAREG